jgi:hypothetical protein
MKSLITSSAINLTIPHQCIGSDCDQPLDKSTKTKLYGLNLTLSLISLGIALTLSLSPMITGRQMMMSSPSVNPGPQLAATPQSTGPH